MVWLVNHGLVGLATIHTGRPIIAPKLFDALILLLFFLGVVDALIQPSLSKENEKQ